MLPIRCLLGIFVAIFLLYTETRLLAFSESSATKIPMVLIVPPKAEDTTATWQQRTSTVKKPVRIEPAAPHAERLPTPHRPTVIYQVWSTL